MRAILIRIGFFTVVVLALSPGGGRAGDDSSNYGEDLTTLNGKTYYQVRLVKVDPNGLLFRHRNGIAKVTFDNLEPGFRDHYGYSEADAEAFETSHASEVQAGPAATADPPTENEPEIVVTFRTRTLIPLTMASPFSHAPSACGGVRWYSHWARYHPGLAYAHFPCRQLAVRDLLISSGIVPTRPGVVFRRWYR